MGNMLVMYGVEAAINTGSADAEEWSTIQEGIDNLSEALNEVVQQYFFMAEKGFASNYVTGMAPSYTFTGRRIIGDKAQDWIFSPERKFGLMEKRDTTFKITRLGSGGKPEEISCPVTIANLTDIGGATTDGSAISFEVRFNGKPEIKAPAV